MTRLKERQTVMIKFYFAPTPAIPPQDAIKKIEFFITGCDENCRFHYLHSPARVSLAFKRKRDLIKLTGTEDEITFTVC